MDLKRTGEIFPYTSSSLLLVEIGTQDSFIINTSSDDSKASGWRTKAQGCPCGKSQGSIWPFGQILVTRIKKI
jgi:hypothetical protein